MSEAVDIAGTENEGTAQLEGVFQLERVLPEIVLAMTSGLRPFAPGEVVTAKEMEDICFLQIEKAIRGEIIVNQERKIDPGLLSEPARVLTTSEANGGDARTAGADLSLMSAQLRDVLAAEDSTPVPQKDNDRRLF